MEPKTPLPADVPELPPGRFYRVTRDGTFSFPMYTVEIREQHRRFSTFVAKAPVMEDASPTPEDAVIDAAHRAHDIMHAQDERRAKWLALDNYLGDHGREDAK